MLNKGSEDRVVRVLPLLGFRRPAPLFSCADQEDDEGGQYGVEREGESEWP